MRVGRLSSPLARLFFPQGWSVAPMPPSPPLTRHDSHDTIDMDEKKRQIDHLEHFDQSGGVVGAKKSSLDSLSVRAAVRVYWKSSFYCFLAAFAAMW